MCWVCGASEAVSDQYQSNELLEAKGMSSSTVKSISELEADLNSLTDAYAKDSTARYLARYYAQKSGDDNLKKSIEYYGKAINGDGLSVYARQATALELAALLYVNERYQAFLQSVEHYLEFGGQLKSELMIQQALAHYYLHHKQTALELAGALFNGHLNGNMVLNLQDLNQLLFIFYNLNDLLNSIQLQKSIIELDSYNYEHWLRLSKLYLKNNSPQKAADTLLLVTQKGLVQDQADLLLMCELLVKSGNPFVGARLLQQFFEQFSVDHTLENYDKLFRYWYLAQELTAATAALKQSLTLNQDIARYLDLAELYYQQQDWLAMNETVKLGCENPLQNKQLSRANLLLGISELKLGNLHAAKQAFINASAIGGRIKQAVAYLKYLKVERADPQQKREISGPCNGP